MSAESERARVFVALALGEEFGARLAALVAPSLEGAPFRPTRAEGLHLTLVFLGDVARARLADLGRGLREELAGGLEPGPREGPGLRLEGSGAFPALERARVLWIGVAEVGFPGVLEALRKAVLAGLRRGGLEEAKERRLEAEAFHPHVTVARARGRNPRAPRAFAELSPGLDWRPEAVELLESRVAPGGSRFLALERIPFSSSSGNPARCRTSSEPC